MSVLDSHQNYLIVSKVTPISIFILMIFGGYVKALGAGLACPDWPLCHNQLIPIRLNGDPPLWVFMEFTHRIIALSVTVIIIILVLFAYSHQSTPKGYQRFLLTLTIFTLLFVQILLGALTVFLTLNEIVVTTHLTVALMIFGFSIVHFYWITI